MRWSRLMPRLGGRTPTRCADRTAGFAETVAPAPLAPGEPAARPAAEEALATIRRAIAAREPSGTRATDQGALPFPSTGPQGHRARMREKLLSRGSDALADYELLEMLLFFAMPKGDTKPLAKA